RLCLARSLGPWALTSHFRALSSFRPSNIKECSCLTLENMAHLLRGKQAGIQNDLSAGLGPDLFVVDDVYPSSSPPSAFLHLTLSQINRFGINSQISQIAYDPVQSLLAVGTNDTQFGPGQIYIFGQKRINVTLYLPRRASVKILQFCADKLLCL